MLEKARSALESFKSQWKSGEHQDDFELSMFAAAQEEYESGAGHKGLLAKIGAETSFDEKLTKASYMKARTAQLMGKKEAVLGAMLKIQKLNIEIERLQSSLLLLSDMEEPEVEVRKEFTDKVVYDIDRKYKARVAQWSRIPSVGLAIMFGVLGFMVSFALLALLMGYEAGVLFSLIIAIVVTVYAGKNFSNRDDEERNQEYTRYVSEIADTTEITRLALEKQNVGTQDQLKSLERTEQTVKNLIATRESTASTLEGLFG
tara:strand:- start:520 stop:1299 length:780 start_codon:yes stop_codon:yes gene_type:complete